MYLKRIEIHGFKSFADKTTISFLEKKQGRNSITAIVGPNGSGKSNVSDAIRWVMGEQSMKQLRGKKAEDIIFSGSESKGKMGVASVQMVLDNSDGRAGLDYDELVIGRRIYRSGDSEYLINGAPVRLLDLQLLLAKAQFGNGAYAVIGQGMIDRLLLQSSGERKQFFDEAAGIKEYQIKRHQAYLRLNRTKDSIEQAELLLNEISPRLKSLQKQVRKLEERKEFELQLQEQQEIYYATMHTHHQRNLDELTGTYKQLAQEVSQGEAQLQTIQQELAQLAHQSSRQEAFAALQKQYQVVATKKNDLERDRAVIQGKLQTEYSRSGQHQMGWLEQKVSDLQSQQEQLTQTIDELKKTADTLSLDILELEKKKEEKILQKTQHKQTLLSLESKKRQHESQQTFFQATGLRAVQAVLEARHRLGDIFGIVAQLGRVESTYQIALDVAAGGNLTSIVVSDEDVSRAAVQYLREGRFGVATFLPVTKIRGRDIPHWIDEYLGRSGVHGLAIDLIDFDDKFYDVFSYALGSTIVVEDFDTAKSLGIGRVRMVTLEGDLFETSGAIKGGHRRQKQGASFSTNTDNLLSDTSSSYEEDMTELQQTIDLLDIEVEQLSQQIQEKRQAELTAKNKMELLMSQQQHQSQETAGLQQELALQTMSPEEYGDVMAKLTTQKDDIEQALVAIEQELTKAQEAIDRFNDEEEAKKQRVFSLQDAMQQQQLALNTLVEQKNNVQVERAKLETKQEDLHQELFQELHMAVESLIEKGCEIVSIQDLEGVQVAIQKLKYKLSLIGGIDPDVVSEYEETKARFDDLFGQLEDLQKATKDLETLIDELDTVMRKKRKKAFADIRREFSRYFSLLFEGGKADLIEIYGTDKQAENQEDDDLLPEDEQEQKKTKTKKILTGIDVTACPPGKKIKHLQALSGGERTMTSIALMCAILKTNPSPFIVLDEVEAALDEANTLRVVNILKELSHDSQFIVITHNRVTMHAADALYGVTMGNDGMSRLLSVKLEQAEEIVE